jgi:predicted nucleotidyltransferase component of viral defense system
MISNRFLIAWRKYAPWPTSAQIEQDLIISRILIEIYKDPYLADHLIFRGGTALNKLFAKSPQRYSEDVDLVQIHPGPIGKIFQHLDDTISPWLGKYKWKQGEGRVTLYFNFEPTEYPGTSKKIKIEINTREHFNVYGITKVLHNVDSPWFEGKALITAYTLEEMLGTKLRALYQRRKGRDLFDLYIFLKEHSADPKKIITAFTKYLAYENKVVSRAEFEKNLHLKSKDPIFLSDMQSLILNPELYDVQDAYQYIMDEIISILPGEPWKMKKG